MPSSLSLSKSLSPPTISEFPELISYMRDHCLPRRTKWEEELIRWGRGEEKEGGEGGREREEGGRRQNKDECLSKSRLSSPREVSSLDHPNMAGAPDEAMLLGWLIELMQAKKVLEIGVFRGSSTLTMALSLPEGGKVYGLDVTEEYVRGVGDKYWKAAGVEEKIEMMVGPALESMERLIAEGHSVTFDFCFIDADKENYSEYYEKSLTLLRKGGVVAVDNTFMHGKVLDEESKMGQGVHRCNQKILGDERVSMVMIPSADGVSLCRKR